MEHDVTPFGYLLNMDQPDPGEKMEGDKENLLWFRANDSTWNRYEEDLMRQSKKYDSETLNRLGKHYGWN